MKAKNKIWEDWINRLTYWIIVFFSKVKENETNISPALNLEPIWVTGLFRSGTTITTQILEQLGMNLGPKEDLLKGIGKRKSLNPQGFYENYLMMELSIYLFKQLNAWGDNPPKKELVEKINLNSIDYKEFVYESVVNVHDDRISNWNKKKILQSYYAGNITDYFRNHFRAPFAIKNPHFSLLTPVLDRYYPSGKYLVVFRNPKAAVLSAQKVTPRANYSLYNAYYETLIGHSKVIFFSYDELLSNPIYSISQLKEKFQLLGSVEAAKQLLHPKKTLSDTNSAVPLETNMLYELMLKKAINKSK